MTKARFYTQDSPRFSRRWWLRGTHDLFWVTVVTVLIWLFADLEFTDRMAARVSVELHTGGSPDRVLLSKKNVLLNFEVQGSRASLDRLRTELTNRGSKIRFDLSNYGPNDKVVPAEDILERELGIAKAGRQLLSVQPRMIYIDLDRRILVHDVPVEFVCTGADLAAPAIIKPPKIAVHVAESLWKALLEDEPSPKLQTKSVDLQTIATSTITVEVVRSIEAPNRSVSVEPEQGTVEVTIQISQPTDEKTITVTVRMLAPGTWAEDDTWKEYSLVRKDPIEWRREITVRGSKTDLERLDEKSVEAYVVLTDDDKKPVASWLTRKVQVRFPHDLQLKVVGEWPTVSFKLVPRSGTGGP